MSTKHVTTTVKIRRVDAREQIVWGAVYEPYRLDSEREFMLPEDIKQMAHRFLRLPAGKSIDVMHDEAPIEAFPVESFIARAGDPDFPEGAWVLGVKIEDEAVWGAVENGTLNAFSFQALVRPKEVMVEVLTVRDHVGRVEPEADHSHLYFVQLNEYGRVTRGWTSPGPDGHVHEIKRPSVTEPGAGHTHRYFV